MNCFHCGRQIELNERIGFREVCPGCERPLHVCRNCDFYDEGFNNQCREPQAERVVDKDRANFCEYFSPGKTRKLAPPAANDVRAKLEGLFKKKG
ncbi:MAG TPA: hypothetical protein VJ728_05985 [Candidatus Binataceae bacterium]|nr:hypothetical protein [Candidatus Binataceae bacterium]